jgi:hypothetical protein
MSKEETEARRTHTREFKADTVALVRTGGRQVAQVLGTWASRTDWCEENAAFPVAVLWRLLSVSPGGFYAKQGRPQSSHSLRDEVLSAHVAAAHFASNRRW